MKYSLIGTSLLIASITAISSCEKEEDFTELTWYKYADGGILN
jgi:alpha-glucosidase (family GH31 glycosyl hydrolase)